MITDEMIKKSKKLNNPKGFYVIDDNYILIRDDLEESWIEKTKRLRARGVNYCGPIELKKVDNQTYALEHRARGKMLDITSTISGKDDYFHAFEEYMNNLRLLYNAPQEQYDKFFDDIDKMAEEGLKPDVCTYGNLFYDPEVGFSFIDVYPNVQARRLSVNSIFDILLNNKFRIGGVSLLPEELGKEYNLMMRELYRKITAGLIKFGYPEEEIKRYVDRAVHSFSENECVCQGNIQETFNKRLQEVNSQNFLTL